MCGIVGMMARQQSGFSSFHVDIFKELLFANQVRGAHGTGMLWNVGVKCRTLKSPVPSSFFIGDEKVKEGFNEIYQKSSFAIGHNRHATKGGLDMESTHPFRVGHITLIHNGTLQAHKHMKDVAVDSEAITYSMAEIGVIPTLEKLEGAFALVWYDADTRTLNFIRNEERPLFLIETVSSWFIASEAKMADWVLSRNKAFIKNIESVSVGKLHTYSVETRTLTTKKVAIQDKYSYMDNWNITGNGTYKYYPPAPKTTSAPINMKDLPKPIIPDITPHSHQVPAILKDKEVSTFTYRLGAKVTFSPIQIITSNRTHYLEGLIEDDNTESLEVRFYNGNVADLQKLLKETLLTGIIMQVYYRNGAERYILKEVKSIPSLSIV